MLKKRRHKLLGSGQRFESRIASRWLLKTVVEKCCQAVWGAQFTFETMTI